MQQLSNSGTGRPLKNSAWVQERLGYVPGKQRSAFWQFASANALPMIRMGQRRIMFDEVAVEAWLNRRSTGGKGAA